MTLQLIALLLAILLALWVPRDLLRPYRLELHATAVISLVIGIGGLLLQMLFAPKPKDQYGARLSDVNVAAVSPGNPIIRHWGTMKLPCQVIWVSKIKETSHTESQSSGGKGGGGGATSTTYTYSVSCAIAICDGPVERVNIIYANQKPIYIDPTFAATLNQKFDDAYVAEATRLFELGTDPTNAYVGGFFFAFNNFRTDNEADLSTQSNALSYITSHPIAELGAPNSGEVNQLLGQMLSGLSTDQDYPPNKQRYDSLALYLGTATQLPDATIESFKGVGNVPGYRHTCYFVLNNLQLEDFGNTIPTFSVEVQKTLNKPYLSEIISDICAESGMKPGEYDALSNIAMIDDPQVEGFAVTQVTAGRSILQDLMKIYPFDACESGYRILFDWINKRAHISLRREDFGAHVQGEQQPQSEEITRTADFDMPQQVKFSFQEPSRNYSKNVAYAARQVLTQSNMVDDIDITIAMTRAEAKMRAEQTLVNRYMARRTFKWFLPKKYVYVEPGDICLVPDKFDTGYFEEYRAMEINIGANSVVEATMIDHHFAFPVQSITEDDLVTADDDVISVNKSGRTRAYMMDLPLLLDSEADDIGYYVVLAQSQQAWGGGFLIVDTTAGGTIPVFGTDTAPSTAGSNWIVIAKNDRRVVHGYSLNSLGAATPGIWDYASYIDVYLVDPKMIFSAAVQEDLYSNAENILVVGDEVLQFADVEDLQNGVWRLKTFLRGLRGTEWAIGSHVRGDRVVKITSQSLKRVTHNQQYLDIQGSYKALTQQESSADETAFNFTNTGRSLMPYAPDVRFGHRTTTGDLTLEWQPRNRQNGQWLSGQDIVLDQATEEYQIDVYNSAGTAVVKTYTFTGGTRTWSYVAADQTTDIGSVPTNLKLDIYQIGNIIGRGFVSTITVPKP